MILDNSDITLDLIHVLQLLDDPSNYGKVLNMVHALGRKLDIFQETIKNLEDIQKVYDLETVADKIKQLQDEINAKQEKLNKYRPIPQ